MANERIEDERYVVCMRRTDAEAFRHFYGRIPYLTVTASQRAARALREALDHTQTWLRKFPGRDDGKA